MHQKIQACNAKLDLAKRHMLAVEQEKEHHDRNYRRKILKLIKFGKRGFKRQNQMKEFSFTTMAGNQIKEDDRASNESWDEEKSPTPKRKKVPQGFFQFSLLDSEGREYSDDVLLELFEDHTQINQVESEDEKDATMQETELAHKILAKLGVRVEYEEDLMKHQRERLMKEF